MTDPSYDLLLQWVGEGASAAWDPAALKRARRFLRSWGVPNRRVPVFL